MMAKADMTAVLQGTSPAGLPVEDGYAGALVVSGIDTGDLPGAGRARTRCSR